MSRNYKFHNPEGVYFVSFAVVDWLDVFTREEYVDILIKNLKYCQENKGMEIYAWCIMTNHVHLVFRSINGVKPEAILGGFKSFTSRKIVEAIKANTEENRREELLAQFKKYGARTSNVKNYMFWRHDNHPIELWSNKVTAQKINYVHNNPVKAGMVEKAEEYRYSSAGDYAGGKGKLEVVVCI